MKRTFIGMLRMPIKPIIDLKMNEDIVQPFLFLFVQFTQNLKFSAPVDRSYNACNVRVNYILKIPTHLKLK